MPSITQLTQDINTADINSTGTVSWTAATGLKYIVQSLADLSRDRGFMVATSVSGLALLGGNDTKLAIVEGKGLYKFNPSGFSPAPGGVLAMGGGVWELLFDLSTYSAPKYMTIGDGSTTTIAVQHDQNSLYPDVSVYNILNTPYTMDAEGADYTVQIVDANNINLVYATAPTVNSKVVKIKSS